MGPVLASTLTAKKFDVTTIDKHTGGLGDPRNGVINIQTSVL